MTSWIFQGNPSTFDLDGYLRATPSALWTVRQKYLAPKMRVGDRVFFWRASACGTEKPGIVAAGRIESTPQELPQDTESLPYTKDEAVSGTQLRVRVAVEKVADSKGVIKRDWLKDDPILSDLRILRFASETNYRLSDAHSERLELLWANTGRDWTEEEALAGLWAYARTRGGAVSRLPGSPVSDVALAIGRAVTGAYNKVMNFRAIDPTDDRDGLPSVSETDRTVWARYFDTKAGTLDVGRVTADYERIWLEASSPKPASAGVAGTPPDAPGTEPNPLIRKRIEQRAVAAATEWYLAAGFEVKDVGNTEAFDLRCTREGKEVRVEVKGTRGAGLAVLLTDGEVQNARLADGYRVDLFVLSKVEVSIAEGVVTAGAGVQRRIENWSPESERLAATVYRYQLP